MLFRSRQLLQASLLSRPTRQLIQAPLLPQKLFNEAREIDRIKPQVKLGQNLRATPAPSHQQRRAEM